MKPGFVSAITFGKTLAGRMDAIKGARNVLRPFFA